MKAKSHSFSIMSYLSNLFKTQAWSNATSQNEKLLALQSFLKVVFCLFLQEFEYIILAFVYSKNISKCDIDNVK